MGGLPDLASTSGYPVFEVKSAKNISSSEFTTEELIAWVSRFTKHRTQLRRNRKQDLRREVIIHCALQSSKKDLRLRQEDRQRRWRELKTHLLPQISELSACPGSQTTPIIESAQIPMQPLSAHTASVTAVRSYWTEEYVQSMKLKSAHQYFQEMDFERPSTPLPDACGTKRRSCGCPVPAPCSCSTRSSQPQQDNSLPLPKHRFIAKRKADLLNSFKSSGSTPMEEDGFESLDRFLSSLHTDSRQLS